MHVNKQVCKSIISVFYTTYSAYEYFVGKCFVTAFILSKFVVLIMNWSMKKEPILYEKLLILFSIGSKNPYNHSVIIQSNIDNFYQLRHKI